VPIDRRHLIHGGLFSFVASALGGPALAAPSVRALSMLNLHTGERLQAAYWEAGRYVDDTLTAFNHLLRDFRTSDVHPIDPGVFDILSALQAGLSTDVTIQVISGYRSPKTNAALHEASSAVAAHSLHMEGKAIDIRMPGVQLASLRDTAWALQKGGVGFYPKDDFVHVDVGRVRRW
jgi:uncharacterized protein YcbK (DUF882 family)